MAVLGIGVYCHIIAQYGIHITEIDTVPSLVWQPLGNDAVLVGYNEAMCKLTEGGIENALGTASSEFCGERVQWYVQACAQTGQPVMYEVVRRMRTAPGVYRFLALLCPGDDGLVRLYTCPVERVPERERERE